MADIFVRERQAGTTQRISVGTGGAEVNHSSVGPAISADGQFVAFDSLASNLVAGDTNLAYDVFITEVDPSAALPTAAPTSSPVPPTPTLPSTETIITAGGSATRAGVASFAFIAVPAAGATFECSLDGEPFAPCVSIYVSPVIDPGAHNFRVRATTANGTDPTPASRDFIVDREAPTTTIRLEGSRTAVGAFAGSATVEADVTDPALSSGIRNRFCVVDPPAPPTSFGPFGSQPCGVTVTAIGSHTAYAIANDEAGNESAIVSATFSIVAAPDTTITEGPSGVVFSVPSFRFTSNVAGARFECRVDSGAYTACSSAILAYKVFGLAQGTHTFEVRAIGPDGLVDPTPASRTVTLGTQALDGGCSFRFPFRGNEDIGISYGGAVGYPLSEISAGGSARDHLHPDRGRERLANGDGGPDQALQAEQEASVLLTASSTAGGFRTTAKRSDPSRVRIINS